MLVLFVFFYVLPAAALGLGIWLALFGFRELGLPVSWRRVFFVVAVTVLLAPAVVPAGIIFAAFVPNGMLVLNGDLPILHDARLVSFAAISFLVTGALSFALSWVAVRSRESSNAPTESRPLRIAAPAVGIVIMLSLYYSSVPDRRIDAHIDWVLIESVYGESFDALIDLGGISDAADWQVERDRLERLFVSDPVVATVAVTDKRLKTFNGEHTLRLSGVLGQGSCSSNGVMWQVNRMMRCTRKYPGKGSVETLTYRRVSVSALGDEIRSIRIEYDYEAFSDRFTLDNIVLATSGDAKAARLYDERVQGTWRIRQRYRVTVNEEVDQTGTLTVGPRTDFGTYQVIADIQAESSLRPGRESFSRPESACAANVCKWTASVTGTLKVRGNRALIVFDDSFWLSDRLDIGDETMVGRDDWGSATVYERMTPEIVAR